jgi:hypothetical protein
MFRSHAGREHAHRRGAAAHHHRRLLMQRVLTPPDVSLARGLDGDLCFSGSQQGAEQGEDAGGGLLLLRA